MVVEIVWMIAYMAMNLKSWTELEREALPSLRTVSTLEMLGILEVKGAAIEASEEDRDTPMSAARKA